MVDGALCAMTFLIWTMLTWLADNWASIEVQRAFGGRGAFGESELEHVMMDDVNCLGSEASLDKCERSSEPSDCNAATEAAGLVCKPNYGSFLNDKLQVRRSKFELALIAASKCNEGGVLFGSKCYYFYSNVEQLKDFQGDQNAIRMPRFFLVLNDLQCFAGAKEKCEFKGGSLVGIQSQAENDFISEVIFAKFVQGQSWYTAGMEKDHKWRWQIPGGVPASSFSKWIASASWTTLVPIAKCK